MTYLLNNNIDVALVQETWLRKCDSSILKQIKEFGFDILSHRKNLSVEWGGGVAAVYRNNLKVSQIRCEYAFKTFEHVTCKILTKGEPLIMVSVYRRGYSASNKFTVNDFINEFSLLLDTMCDYFPSILITGDFNIHIEQNNITSSSSVLVSKQKEVESFINLLNEYELKQCVVGPTHDLGGTLDLAITSNVSPVFTDVVTGLKNEVCPTDHFHLFMKIPCTSVMKPTKVTLFRRNLSNLSSEVFINRLNSTNFGHKITQCGDVDGAVSLYNTLIFDVFNSSCPQRKLIVNVHSKQKWYNAEHRETKRLVRQIERKYRKHRTSAYQNELNNARNLYKASIEQSRSAFISKICDDNENDTGLIYKTINHYLDEGSNKTLPSHNDDLTLANEMADFFLEKVNKIRTNIDCDPTVDLSLRSSFHESVTDSTRLSSFRLLDDDDVVKLVNDMPCKVNDADPILLSYLKNNIVLFLPCLKHIINLSLQSGIFPSDLKHGTITPILKSQKLDPDALSSYRPVTTLPFMSKLLEKAASMQLLQHLECNDLIPRYQSAYLKAHSCETALFNFVNNVQQMLSEGKIVLLVQLDFSAAFDTVDHCILLRLLQEKFGIDGTVLRWLTSYLSGRSFSVKIGYVNGRRVLLIYVCHKGRCLAPSCLLYM